MKGQNMAKTKNLEDKKRLEIVTEEISKFKALVKGHDKLLFAIGEL